VRDGIEQYEDRRAGPAGATRSYPGTDYVKDGR
jgi:hypothetical protein